MIHWSFHSGICSYSSSQRIVLFPSLAFGTCLNNPEHVSSLSFLVYVICSCSFCAKSALSDSHWKFPRCTLCSHERPSHEHFLLLEDSLSSIFSFLQQLIKVSMIRSMSSVQSLFKSSERSTLSLPVTWSSENWTSLILSSPSPTQWPVLEPTGWPPKAVLREALHLGFDAL